MPGSREGGRRRNRNVDLRAPEGTVLTDAVAAIIGSGDGRYLLQLRDDKPTIPYPDHWCLFGGTIEVGETPVEALHRELDEELGIAVRAPELFSRFDVDLSSQGLRVYRRWVYVATLAARDIASLTQKEGADMGFFTLDQILHKPRLAPYDAYILWLYASRDRYGASAPAGR